MSLPRDLNLLRIFDAVMRERHVTRAAAALHMTQPAVSNALARLRRLLDDPLFVKVAGGISPTPRAQMLWPTVSDCLLRLSQAIEPQRFQPEQAKAMFRMAMSDYVADQLIRPVFHHLQTIAPDMRIHLMPHGIRNVVPMLNKGQIDMAAGVLPGLGPDLRSLTLDTLSYVCAMRRDHPLARKRKFTLDDFSKAQHLRVSLAGGADPGVVDLELADLGVTRSIALTVNQYSLAMRLVVETDLICIVPTRAATDSPYADQLVALPPPCPLQSRSLYLIWHNRTDSEPAHRWLREQFVQVCRQRGYTV